ncbi:hypothetical protein pb186bvf_015493 [Paramecium bursaria]
MTNVQIPFQYAISEVEQDILDSWIIFLSGQTSRFVVGAVWITVTYVSIMSAYKIGTLVYKQNRYENYKKQWYNEVKDYEDEDLIRDINIKYSRILTKYEDRLERYKGLRVQDLYRYLFFIVLISILNVFWIVFDWTRGTIPYGILFGIMHYAYNYIFIPYRVEYEKNQERKELDREIARDKQKQN